MKDLKIGKLLIKKKALITIAFCLFINGMVIGTSVAFKKTTLLDVNVLVLYGAIFLPYLFSSTTIKKNIIEST